MKQETFNKFRRLLDKLRELVGPEAIEFVHAYDGNAAIRVTNEAFKAIVGQRQIRVTWLERGLAHETFISKDLKITSHFEREPDTPAGYRALGPYTDFDAIEPQDDSVAAVLSEQTSPATTEVR